MPRIKKDERQKKDDMFRALVAKNMVLYGYASAKDLAPAIRCSRSTLLNKLNDPDKFTRGELRRLFDALHLTAEERQAMM